MTRATNARIAGFTFLAYIAAGITSMVLFRRVIGGAGVAAKLAGIAAHSTAVGLLVGLGLVQCFSALVLGVTLYAITRDEDGDLAMLGLVCRLGEGFLGALSIPALLALSSLATSSGADALDVDAVHALAAYLLRDDVALTATFFAVGSTAFAYLLLRGRMIPVPLAWLGVVASAVLVVGLPVQLAGWLRGPITSLLWLPMLAFEVPLGLWLLTRGSPAPHDAMNASDVLGTGKRASSEKRGPAQVPVCGHTAEHDRCDSPYSERAGNGTTGSGGRPAFGSATAPGLVHDQVSLPVDFGSGRARLEP